MKELHMALSLTNQIDNPSSVSSCALWKNIWTSKNNPCSEDSHHWCLIETWTVFAAKNYVWVLFVKMHKQASDVNRAAHSLLCAYLQWWLSCCTSMKDAWTVQDGARHHCDGLLLNSDTLKPDSKVSVFPLIWVHITLMRDANEHFPETSAIKMSSSLVTSFSKAIMSFRISLSAWPWKPSKTCLCTKVRYLEILMTHEAFGTNLVFTRSSSRNDSPHWTMNNLTDLLTKPTSWALVGRGSEGPQGPHNSFSWCKMCWATQTGSVRRSIHVREF